MSKKNKIRKKSITQSEPSSEIRSALLTDSEKKVASNTITLINFDRKTKIFLSLLLAGFLLLSLLKIHTSNIANWDLFFGQEKSASVIAGKPRFIRMDEWMISTPAAIAQYNAGMPVKNESVGDLNTPVIWGLPVNDISTVMRPAMWPYFLFDLERAFAFAWNFNVFFFLIGTFLLLMLLTRNNFWVSVTGTFFIFFSGGLQWWSYFIGIYMLYLNGMFISFVYLLYSRKALSLVVSGLIFIFSVYGFLFNLYPPFQVPLIYLYLFLFIGFLWRNKNFVQIKEGWKLKAGISTVVIFALCILLFHYYHLVKETYTMMMNTVYPGKRVSTGGDLLEGKLFSEFFGFFITDTHSPTKWQNICEASSFIMFFPIVFYSMGFYFIKTRKTDTLLLSISAYVILGLIYLLAGIPTFLSNITLFSMSPAFRALPVVALANCILMICFLSSDKMKLAKEKFSWLEFGILAGAIFVFAKMVTQNITKATENFFTSNEVIFTIAFIIVTYLLIRYKEMRFVKPVLLLVLCGVAISNANINPLTIGLSPLIENPLYKTSMGIHKKDPEARWAFFGNTRTTHMLKATGMNIFNTVKLVPPMKDMKVLDPSGVYDSTYNRYAWMRMTKLTGYNDTVVFRQTFNVNDGYTIFIDPCSPKLKQLNIKYLAFDYTPEDVEVRCMTKLTEVSGVSIYRRNDF